MGARQILALLLCLSISVFSLFAQAGVDSADTVQISFAGLRISGISEYPRYGITADHVREKAREEWLAGGEKLSLEVLQNIAGVITALYRQAGFVFTRAYIPQQRSTDGTVEIRLLEGFLEAVDVYDNQDFDEDLVRSAFGSLIGEVIVSADIEEAMALTNDLPGLTVFGFYSVGEQLGGTRINMRVREEKSSSAAVRVDNYGSDLTGSTRMLVEWEKYNVIESGDSLRVGALQTFDPENATYGMIDFQTTLNNPRNIAGLTLSANDYALGRGRSDIGQLDISGDTTSASFNLSRKVKRTAANTQVLSTRLNWDKSHSKSEAFPEVYDLTTESWDVAIAYQLDLQSREQRFWRSVSAEIKPGHYTSGKPLSQPDEFWLFRFSHTTGRLIRIGDEGDYHKLVNRLVGQYSDDVLPPDEQFSLGGASGLRGFEAGQFSADTGLQLSSEWFFPSIEVSASTVVIPSLFLDCGYGVQRVKASGLDDDWASLADVGAALSINVGPDLSMVFSIAQPVDDRISYSDEDIDDVQIYGELTWRFF